MYLKAQIGTKKDNAVVANFARKTGTRPSDTQKISQLQAELSCKASLARDAPEKDDNEKKQKNEEEEEEENKEEEEEDEDEGLEEDYKYLLIHKKDRVDFVSFVFNEFLLNIDWK